MPKPLLHRPQMQNNTPLHAAQTQQQKQNAQQMDKLKLDRLLRKPRSKEYMQVMRKLDVGGHVHNQHKVDEIVDAIRNEFPDVEISGILFGIVSPCCLGGSYEVHTIDVAGQIIEHYQVGQILPDGLERARSLAIHGGYDFIEVYVDCCRAVSADGTVSVIPV